MVLASVRIHAVGLAALLMLMGPCPGAAAAAGNPAGLPADIGPQELVRRTSERLLAALQSHKEDLRGDPARAIALVDEIISTRIDYERMAKWILGKHWRKASEAQRQRFVHEFRTLLLRTYATAVQEHTDVEIEYLPAKMNAGKNKALVRTQIPQRGTTKPIDISYRMHRSDGVWQVFDVTIEGVSLISTYRTAFASEMRKLGLDGLIEQLEEKNEDKGGS